MKEANLKMNLNALCGLKKNTGRLLILAALLLLPALNAVAQPANDAFANAVVLSGLSGTTNGANSLATTETCEPATIVTDDYGAETTHSSVWYQWIAPADGTANFNTIGSTFDSIIAVYTTPVDLCDSGLTFIGADDDGLGATLPQSTFSFAVVSNATYYIAVTGFGASSGNITLNWNLLPPSNATIPSGTFSFTKSLYLVSDLDANPPVSQDGNSVAGNQGGLNGARLTVTRSAGSKGRVLVDVVGLPETYTNSFVTNTYSTNISYTFVDTNGIGSTTNLIQTYTIFANLYQSKVNGNYISFPVTGAYTNFTTQIYSGVTGPAIIDSTNYPLVSGRLTNLPPAIPALTNGFTSLRVANQPFPYTNFTTNFTFMVINTNDINTNFIGSARTDVTFFSQPPLLVTGSTNGNRVNLPSLGVQTLPLTATNSGNTYTNPTIYWQEVDQLSYYYGSNWVYTMTAPSGLPLFFTNLYYTNYVYTNFAVALQVVYTNGGLGAITNPYATTAPFSFGITNFTRYEANNVGAPNIFTFTTAPGELEPIPTNLPPVGFLNLGTLFVSTTNAGTNYASTNVTRQPPVVVMQTIIASTAFVSPNSTLTFDDYEMSKDIVVQVAPAGPAIPGFGSLRSSVINVALANARLDPLESLDLLPPIVGVGTTEVNALSSSYPPGPSIYNFERSRFTVDKDIPGHATISVQRTGFIGRASSVDYVINPTPTLSPGPLGPPSVYVPPNFNAGRNPANTFDLEAGSDYALPDVDFTPVSGTLTWGANDPNPKQITIQIHNNGLVENNADFQVQLYNATPAPSLPTDPGSGVGLINSCLVTILFDSVLCGQQPAGAVDRCWNKDNEADSYHPFLPFPGTSGGVSGGANGNAGTVYALAEQIDGKALVAGSFTSFDGQQFKRLVRLLDTGYEDTTFMAPPNDGANGTIRALALQADGKILIGGDFTSFNGSSRLRVARVNTDGSVDDSFNPGLGADGTVKALAVRADGKVVVAGDFTNFNGVASSYVARLNSDGSMDTNFNVGTTINGSVNSLALGGVQTINLNITPSGGQTEDVQKVNLGSSTAGVLTVFYDMFSIPDDLKIFYGGTNDVQIYDTGTIPDFGILYLQFGPTNGVNTNVLTFVMNKGGGLTNTVWFYDASVTTLGDSTVYLGGSFSSVNGTPSGGVARLKDDGTLDATYAPGIGTYNPNSKVTDSVQAVVIQPDGKLLVGGSFSYFDLANYNGILRLAADGTVDPTFNPGTGTFDFTYGQANAVNSIALQQDGSILIGGDFAEFNQTRRWGIARLFNNGSVDTSFMDTAYNQFAGLVNHYHNENAINPTDYPSGNHRNQVLALAIESSTTNVIIGGSFLRVGGGYTRTDIHPRSNVARLIGGGTPGPGNIQLVSSSYSVDKSAGSLFIPLVRTNGSLGPISATIYTNMAAPGPGIANATDITIPALYFHPLWPTIYLGQGPTFSWTVSPGIYGPNNLTLPLPHVSSAFVYLTINNNSNFTGNVNATIGLSNPDGNSFKLGGEYIGLNPALGFQASAPLTILENNFKPGVMGFNSPTFTVNQNAGTATITVTRTNGTDGIVSVNYATTNGTATNGINFNNVSGTLTFNAGVASRTFTIPIINGTTVQPDKTVILSLSTATGGAQLGQSNAVLTIVNNNFTPGHVSFTSVTFTTNEPATTSSAVITVNRLGGSSGTLAVTFSATNGTATNGVQFTGVTNTLTWNNGDVSTKTVSVPLLHDGIFTPDLNVTLLLTGAKVNTLLNPNALGLNTNVLLTIGNIDFPGTVQFTSDRYSVKKYAGYALIPVVRIGGSSETISVDYNTADVTALAPDDYSATNNTLIFTNGVVSQYIVVPIVNNHSSTNLKTLTVQLTGVSAGVPALATLNIIDTDSVDETPGTEDSTYSSTAGFNGAVFAMALQTNNNKLVVGGDFTQANGVPRRRIARLNADGTLDASFSLPSSTKGADASVRAVVVQSDGRVVLGGQFTNCNNIVNHHLARLNQDGEQDSLFNIGSGADNSVFALAEQFIGGDRKIVVGGSFASINGTTFHGVGRLNDDGTPDVSFNLGGLGANAEVNAVAVQTDGKVLVGGNFTNFNGVVANRVVRLNVNGSVDSTFTGAGANDSVQAIAVQLDGKILIGGAFTNVNGTVLNHIARLNSNGSTDMSFIPGVGANDTVSAIALQTDTRIVLGGQFTRCSGVTRSRVTRLNPDGSVDPRINFGAGADGFVSAIAIQQDTISDYPTNVPDEKIIIGGAFSHYDGSEHQRIARIFGGAIAGVGAFEFSTSDFYERESVLSAVITVNRTGGTLGTNVDGSGSISVPFATSDGSAIAGVNYQALATNVVFPMGEVQQTVNIKLIRDFVITNELDVNLQIDPVSPAEYGDQPIATLHILNDDNEVNFSSPTYQVAKNVVNGVATINVLRIGSGYGTASVIFNTTTNGSATAGLDYTPVTNYLVTFIDGVTNVAVNIPIINNLIPEGFRTVGIELTNPVNTVLYSPSNAVLTIVDTVNSPGQISLSTNNYYATPTDGNAVLTVTRTNGSSGTVTVNYRTVAQTAVPGSDYATSTGILTFDSGVLTQTISVPLLSQTLVQPPVSFSVVLSNVLGGAQLIAPSNATVNIISSIAGINFFAATNIAPETSGTVNVLVQRLFNTNNVATVNYATVAGTALPNVNYVNSTGTLSFTNGESTKVLSISLINRTNVTGDLQFSIKLSNAVGAQLLAQSNTVVVIQDADAGISFTNSTVRVLKSSGSATITVVCSNPRVEPVLTDSNSVPLSVQYFTANGTALAGTDYQSVSGTLYFTNGIATNTFTVPLYNNLSVSGDHSFSVILTNVTAPGQITPYGVQTVVIGESNPGFRFSSSTYTVSENGVQANINVYRTGYTDTVASVNFIATNGTAVNGANFFATNGTLQFTNGETIKSFAVPVIANIAVQPNLTVLLQLTEPTNGVLVSPSVATLNILESGGSYVVPAGSALVSESGPVNGIVDNGETVQLLFAFRDAAGLNVTNLIAYLQATNGVTAPSPASQTYGPLTVYGHSVSRPFTFTAAGTNALPIAATFKLYDNAHFIGNAAFNFTLGTWTTSFTNNAVIVINDNTNASPYPSIINASGIGGTLLKATVTLNALTHTSPADVDALVVSPAGLNTLIMAHAGGNNTVTNIVLTFDDAATNSLPRFGQLNTGTNKPTGFLPIRSFP